MCYCRQPTQQGGPEAWPLANGLGHSGVDLTGVGGILREVTLEQLAAHSKKNDAWIAIRGKFDYSVTMVPQ